MVEYFIICVIPKIQLYVSCIQQPLVQFSLSNIWL